MAETVIQATDTTFARQGYSFQQRAYLLPGSVNSGITSAYTLSQLSSSLTTAEQNALYGLLSQNTEIIPGGLTLYNVHSLDPIVFSGSGDLQAIYQRDPFGTDYEDETEELYVRSYSTARAAAQSGPTNVRGGTARQALELADLDTQMSINRFREIWQTQLATADLVTKAIEMANRIETERWRLQLSAQQLQAGTEQGKTQQVLAAAEQVTRARETNLRTLAAAAEFFGVPQMRSDEDLRGVGYQSGVQTNFGMSYWR
jgi:hypothetical protein